MFRFIRREWTTDRRDLGHRPAASMRSTVVLRGTRAAFTLMEVILVLVIMGILATLSMPLLQGPLQENHLEAAGDALRAEWAEARVTAMETGLTYVFVCELGGAEYTLTPIIGPEYVNDAAMRNMTAESSAGDLVGGGFSSSLPVGKATRAELPDGVYFSDVMSVGPTPVVTVEYSTSGGFDSTPTVQPGGGVEVSGQGYWSEPVYFFPDGTTSDAICLLKNKREHCLELGIRGLTGLTEVSDTVPMEDYMGQLDATIVPNAVSY